MFSFAFVVYFYATYLFFLFPGQFSPACNVLDKETNTWKLDYIGFCVQ